MEKKKTKSQNEATTLCQTLSQSSCDWGFESALDIQTFIFSEQQKAEESKHTSGTGFFQVLQADDQPFARHFALML